LPQPPPINPDINDIAYRAKHGYAVNTRLLAAVPVEVSQSGRTEPHFVD
jgi:hypothetical protein